MKKIIVMTMIIVGVLSPGLSQTDKAMRENKPIEQVRMFAVDPGTG